MWLFGTLRGRLLLVALVFVLMIGARWVFGHADGEACSDAFLCRALPGRCVQHAAGSFCSRPCAAPGDCQAGWYCGMARRMRQGELVGTEQVCLLPGTAPPFDIEVRR